MKTVPVIITGLHPNQWSEGRLDLATGRITGELRTGPQRITFPGSSVSLAIVPVLQSYDHIVADLSALPRARQDAACELRQKASVLLCEAGDLDETVHHFKMTCPRAYARLIRDYADSLKG